MKRALEPAQAIVLMIALALCPDAAKSRTFEFVERVVDASLSIPNTVAISHDGRHVYVGAYRTLVFERDAATGELAYLDTFGGSQAIAISPDDRHNYQTDFGWLRALTRDPATGALSQVEAWRGGMAGIHQFSATFAALSPDGRNVYASTRSSALVAFTRDPRTGVVDYLETQLDGVGGVDGLGGGLHVSVSPDGAQVAVVSFPIDGGYSSVAVFDRDPDDGSLEFGGVIFGGAEGIQAIDGARFVLFSPDGRHFYVAGRSSVATFARNTRDRMPQFTSAIVGRTDALEISPDGRFLYAVNDQDAEVKVLARNADSGSLDPIESFSNGIEDFQDLKALAATPDGKHLYIVSDHGQGGVAALQRDSVTGKLSLISVISADVDGDFDGLRSANALAASPDGKNLYVTSDLGRVTALSRSSESGRLSAVASYHYTEGFDGLDGAESVTVSPDGLNVYIASQRPDALIALSRDTMTGELDFLETHFDGEAGVDGLDLAESVRVSPDGRNVYVIGFGDHALAVFGRDTSSGHLEFLEVHIDGIDGVEGLSRPTVMAVSPDGRHVYVGGIDEPALATFHRDAETGRLDFLHVTQANDYVSNADLLVSPDGRNLYVGGSDVGVFVRNPSTGELDFLESHTTFTSNLAISPDGETLYAIGSELKVFSREPTAGALQLIETDSYSSGFNSQAAVLSPDGEHLYFPSWVEFKDALTVLRRTNGLCRATVENLCLADNRFRVDVEWNDFTGRTGIARGVPLGSDDSGLLWFFDSENWEMLIKVLDGCSINDRFWVLAAGTTDVQYSLRVTDLLTDLTKTYSNPLGEAAPAIVDTDAFASCDASNATGKAGRAPSGDFLPRLGSDLETLARPEISPAMEGLQGREMPSAEQELEKRLEPNRLLIGVGGKCLDIEGGGTTDGTPVHLFDCHRESNQRWQFVEDCDYGGCTEDFEIRGLEDLCLQPAASSTATPLIVGSCGGSEDRWIFRGYFPQRIQLEHVASGLCADVEGAEPENGTPINLYDCHDGANQLWDFREIRCIESPIHRCLNQERFLVDVEWRDFEGKTGIGRALPQGSADSGMYWFFTPNNWELLVKVLDGCAVNSHHWVFSAATTNVEYNLRITDTETGQIREYFNPLGQAASAITDTSAFNTCP